MGAKNRLPHDHGNSLDAILKKMPGVENFSDAAATFQQLCDTTRLRIFWIICHSEECVSNIAAAVEMTDAAVSHHLRTLKMHGLIKNRRVGKEVHYSIAENDKAQLAHQMLDDYFRICCPAAHRKRDSKT